MSSRSRLTLLALWLRASLASPGPWATVGGASGLRGVASDRSPAILGGVDHRRLPEQRFSECNIRPLMLMSPPSFQEWQECIENGADSLNRSIAGAEVALLGNCWCESEALQTVQNHTCCDHPDFVGFCQIDCQADCTSEAAQACIRECPAICLEAAYAPEDCFERCMELDCIPYLLCTTDHAQDTAHRDPAQLTCNDEGFHSSEEMLSYLSCMQTQPMRTNWQRWNSQHHCFCESNLKDAAERHRCCGADWSDPICDVDCRTPDECTSVPGTACSESCAATCDMIHPHLIREQCHDDCFAGECDHYKTCEPAEPRGFEYACDNGEEPDTNGCCPGASSTGLLSTTCPALCQSGRKYILPHGDECQCFDCPTSAQEAEVVLTDTFLGDGSRPGGVSEDTWQNGQSVLVDIARKVGLVHGATPHMQAMMVARNIQIREAIESAEAQGTNTPYMEIKRISTEWHTQIEVCARGGPSDTACDYQNALQHLPEYAVPEPAGGDDDEEGGGGLMIVVVIAAAVAILGGAAGAFVFMQSKKRTQQGGGTTRPMDGDSNVVVGRPVDDSQPPQFAAAEGAPVAGDAAKGDGEK